VVVSGVGSGNFCVRRWLCGAVVFSWVDFSFGPPAMVIGGRVAGDVSPDEIDLCFGPPAMAIGGRVAEVEVLCFGPAFKVVACDCKSS
jgi:hypothetical protein